MPGTDGAANSAFGLTTVQGLLGANFFVLIYENSSAGTYDIYDLGFGKYTTVTHSDGSGKGRVKVTSLTANQIKGTFNADLADDQGNMHHVIGSFNVGK